MPSPGRDDPDGHISVYWLDAEIQPSLWEQLERHWRNLPAAIVVAIIVIALLVPKPSLSIPVPPMPTFSIPNPAFGLVDREEEATPEAVPTVPATHEPVALTPGIDPAVVASTGVSSLSDLAVRVAHPPNELGGVPIIMYHAFVHNEENTNEWTLTYDQFREQLDWFREHDYVMAGMQSMIDGRFDVPAGKKPIVLTFDDASSGQFGLQEAEGGGYEVRPDTAVGVLEAYRTEYPEFAGPAFFAVLPWNCFASDDDPSSCEDRLNWLIEHDYEIGNHTYDHVDLTDVAPDFFTKSIASMELWIDERIPEGRGNLSNVLVLPYGAYPDAALHGDQRSWLAEGFWYLGEPVNLELVLGVNGGPAISPYSTSCDPVETYRIASDPTILGYWQEQMESGETSTFVSDGEPETVTIPADLRDRVDMTKLEYKGLTMRTYDRDEP